MSQIIQAILLLSVPLFVYKKWLEYSKQFNLKKRNIVLPLLNSGENPETFRAIRNQIEKNFELKQGVRFQYSLTIERHCVRKLDLCSGESISRVSGRILDIIACRKRIKFCILSL